MPDAAGIFALDRPLTIVRCGLQSSLLKFSLFIEAVIENTGTNNVKKASLGM